MIEDSEVLSAANEDAERVYLGLRTVDGLSSTPSLLETAAPWIDAGWATVSGERLRLTATGWLRLDTLATHLTTIASRS
jgi:coproporphyrinogen III oxidase-like Fe-S oxidoreductase